MLGLENKSVVEAHNLKLLLVEYFCQNITYVMQVYSEHAVQVNTQFQRKRANTLSQGILRAFRFIIDTLT